MSNAVALCANYGPLTLSHLLYDAPNPRCLESRVSSHGMFLKACQTLLLGDCESCGLC